jgi:hypothetical protein
MVQTVGCSTQAVKFLVTGRLRLYTEEHLLKINLALTAQLSNIFRLFGKHKETNDTRACNSYWVECEFLF